MKYSTSGYALMTGCGIFVAAFLWLGGATLYEVHRKPNLLKQESVGKIIDARAVGGYRSSPRLEVRTDTGNVFVLNSTPAIRIGAEAYLYTWDQKHARKSLSWTGSESSFYLED
jgi:hypothetical protein